ncbi:MAG: protein kinase domain-containing protein [Thermoanaerobaculia bacterium]
MASSLDRGITLAHYRILSALGAGGMGEVYEALDERLDRAVALKVLPPEFVQNEERVRRFVLEAKSASGLNHPHIVTIYDIGHAEPEQKDSADPSTPSKAVHYIAMELVRGLSLRDKIHGEKAPLKELIRWLAQVAEGMAKAHAAGIVHRDLKPDNVMISNDGFAKILDFGLAKLIEGKSPAEGGASMATDVRDTQQGAVMGTVGYMSPEQVQGRVVDARSDIFSFGCILYEATTRQRAFEADSQIETMHQIINAAPAPVAELNPDAPAELRRLIRRCLAKDPEKRYQSMRDIALDLFELVDEFDTLSANATSQSSSNSGSGSIGVVTRRRSWPFVAAVVVLIAALTVLGVLFLRRQAPGALPPLEATFTQLTDLSGQETQPAISPDGQYLAYVAPSPDSSGSDIFLLRVGGRNPINLTRSASDGNQQPAFAPDGQSIAFRSERGGGGIYVMGATGESVRRIADFGFNPSFSPDGKRIVVSTETGNTPSNRPSDAQLWAIEVQTGENRKIYDGDAVMPRWSPNGHRIAFWGLPYPGQGQRDILTIPADGGEAVPVTDDPPLDWSPAWAPDGESLYFASDRGGSMNLWRAPIDESTGELTGPLQALTTPSAWSGELDMARTAARIVYAASSTEINVHRITIDPRTMKVVGGDVPVTSGSTPFVDPDISPDGSTVVMRSWSVQEDLYLVNSDGSDLRKITDDAAKDRAPRWSRDGKRIAFYSDRTGRYEIWTIDAEGSNLQQVTKTTGPILWSPSWSPDGQRILTSNVEGTQILSLTGALPVSTIEKLPPIEEGLTFLGTGWSADGNWLAGRGLRDGSSVREGIWAYSLEDKKYSKLSSLATEAPPVSWMPDSRHVVFASGNRLIIAVDRVTLATTEVFKSESHGVRFPSLTADGSMIYFNAIRRESDIWMATVE